MNLTMKSLPNQLQLRNLIEELDPLLLVQETVEVTVNPIEGIEAHLETGTDLGTGPETEVDLETGTTGPDPTPGIDPVLEGATTEIDLVQGTDTHLKAQVEERR